MLANKDCYMYITLQRSHTVVSTRLIISLEDGNQKDIFMIDDPTLISLCGTVPSTSFSDSLKQQTKWPFHRAPTYMYDVVSLHQIM